MEKLTHLFNKARNECISLWNKIKARVNPNKNEQQVEVKQGVGAGVGADNTGEQAGIQVAEAGKQEKANNAIKEVLGKEFKLEDGELKSENDQEIDIQRTNCDLYNISQGRRVQEEYWHVVKMLNVKIDDALNKETSLKNVAYNLGTYKGDKKHGVHITKKQSGPAYYCYYRDGVLVPLKKRAAQGPLTKQSTVINVRKLKNSKTYQSKLPQDCTSFAYKVLSQMPRYMMSHEEVRRIKSDAKSKSDAKRYDESSRSALLKSQDNKAQGKTCAGV